MRNNYDKNLDRGRVMAENALLSSPRWADKQMPAPGLALRQEGQNTKY